MNENKEMNAISVRTDGPSGSPDCSNCGRMTYETKHYWICGNCGQRRKNYDSTKQTSDSTKHEWRWHATGAGMGWCCDRCDGYHGFKSDEDRPPENGCEANG